MKLSLTILLSGFIFFAADVFGQENRAEKMIAKGNKHYNKGHFEKAQKFYVKALQDNSNNAYANLFVGIELLESAHRWEALPYIQKAAMLNREISDQLNYYLGQAYQYNYNFEMALHHFHLSKASFQNYNADEKADILKRIEQCAFGKTLYKTATLAYKVENLGPEINSSYRDYAPVIAPQQEKLIFTSNRSDKKKKDGEYFSDIYFVNRDEDKWKQAKEIGRAINTKYDEMGLSFNSEGNALLIHGTKNNGDIFLSEYANGMWGKAINLGENINTSEYMEASACFSADGKIIYFTSNRPGGIGGMDIYMSHLSENGTWGKAINMGRQINTPENDEAPFINTDGNMLFFSSEGHAGIGGYDVFYAIKDELTGEWNTPVNMGLSVNTPQEDINFVLSRDGHFGFYSAIRLDTYGGEDIYKVSIEPNLKGEQSLMASLNMTDDKQFQANIENNIQLVFASYSTGGYQTTEEVLFRNIYFDINEKELDSNSYVELNKMAEYLLHHDGATLKISGHTDNTGPEKYNLTLSFERATSVYHYLVNKGVPTSQLMKIGRGINNPLATNDDELEGRELNRRVELEVLPAINYTFPAGASYARRNY